MNERLTGKVAIVSGGAGRIGSATARRLAAEGAHVMIADKYLEGAEAVAAEIGDSAAAVALDAADETSVRAMIEATVDRFGQLDILHNNVANMGDSARDLTAVDTEFAVWDLTMAVNLRSYFAACKYAIPHMIAAGGGSIINTASCAAYTGDAFMIAYATSKAAILGLTSAVATQHGRQGIRCNAIAPGLIVDEGIERDQGAYVAMFARHVSTPYVGRGDDIAAMVAFLASDDARYMTGECVRVDGGFLARQPVTADVFDMMAG